jgi:hypothetical protein
MEVDKLPYKDLVALAKSLDVPNAGQTARAALVTAVQQKLAAGVQPKPPESTPPADTKPSGPPADSQPQASAEQPLAPPAPAADPQLLAPPPAKPPAAKPAPAPAPAPKAEPPVDEIPKCVRVLKSAWIEKDGRKTQVHLRDVFSGEFAAFLWKTYPKLVERYPITKR